MKWFARRRNRTYSRKRMAVEQLEDRTVPAVIDLTTVGSQGTVNNGTVNNVIFSQGSLSGTGTGNIDSFVRLSTNTPQEKGYNTDARPTQFDENSSASFTKAIKIGYVPTEVINGVRYRRILLDTNQNNSGT